MHDVCKFQGFLAKIQKITLHPIMAHAFDIDGLNPCQVNEVQWEKRFHGMPAPWVPMLPKWKNILKIN